VDAAGDAAETRLIAVSQRWWDDVWRDGNLDAIDEIFTDPFVRHTGTGSERADLRAYKARISEFQRVLTRAETVTWLIVQRIEDGRIAEHWVATFPGVDWHT
jgi:hypothetical protein